MPEETKDVSAALMERLRKLLAQAEGEREIAEQYRRDGNESSAFNHMAAAEAFAAKVQEFLIKYKLSLSDVEEYAQDRDNPFASVYVKPPDWGERYKPRRIERIENLADVIARAHFCRILVLPKTNAFFFAGRKGDADIAAYVFKRLARTAWDLCEKDRETSKKRAQRTPGARWRGNKDFRYNFYWGFANAIYHRYAEQRQSLELQAGECTALVRAERDVELYVKAETSGKQAKDEELTERGEFNRAAFRLGFERGQRVSLDANALNNSGEEARQLAAGEGE